MVRHSIETCYTAQKLSNWENPDKQPVSLNLLGGQSTHSLEELNASPYAPSPARLYVHKLPSANPDRTPHRTETRPGTSGQLADSHREWHCDSQRRSLPRRLRPQPTKGTFTNKIGTFPISDVRRTRGFGEYAPPAVCVVSWDPFNHSKAEVPTWATHSQGTKTVLHQRLVGDHLTSGTQLLGGETEAKRRVAKGNRHSSPLPSQRSQRRARAALDSTRSSRRSVSGGRLSVDLVERDPVDLIAAERLIATPSVFEDGLSTHRSEAAAAPAAMEAAAAAAAAAGTRKQSLPPQNPKRGTGGWHKVGLPRPNPSPRPWEPDNLEVPEPAARDSSWLVDGRGIEPVKAPLGFNFAAPDPPRSAKSKGELLDEQMERMINDNERHILELRTKYDASVNRPAAVPWPWADAEMSHTALGPRY